MEGKPVDKFIERAWIYANGRILRNLFYANHKKHGTVLILLSERLACFVNGRIPAIAYLKGFYS